MNRDAAGKTGTTDSRADANFLGITPQLVAFVWHGHALARIPGAGFGGQIPARIWKRFMDEALYGQPALPLPDPGPVCVTKGAKVSENGRGVPGSAEKTTRPVVTVPPNPITAPPRPPPAVTVPPTTPTTLPPGP